MTKTIIELSEWEMLAVTTVLQIAARKGTLHVEHGNALAGRFAEATSVVLHIEHPV